MEANRVALSVGDLAVWELAILPNSADLARTHRQAYARILKDE